MNKCSGDLHKTTILFLQYLLLVIICTATRVFAGKVFVKLHGGTLVGDDGGEGFVEEVEEGFGEFFGRFFLGVGISCDIAGLSLISIGIVKNQNADKYEKIKNEYELYKQKRAGEVSIHFNFSF